MSDPQFFNSTKLLDFTLIFFYLAKILQIDPDLYDFAQTIWFQPNFPISPKIVHQFSNFAQIFADKKD